MDCTEINRRNLLACDVGWPKDPNPDHWVTINGAKKHIGKNGRFDGGAGGKFNGQRYRGNTEEEYKIKRAKSFEESFKQLAKAGRGEYTKEEKEKNAKKLKREAKSFIANHSNVETFYKSFNNYAKNWENSLTAEEKRSLTNYTFSKGDKAEKPWYAAINDVEDALMGLQRMTPQIERNADNMSSAIKKWSFNKDMVLYRGTDDVGQLLKMNPGEVVEINKFISTSLYKKRAFKKKHRIVFILKKTSSGKAAYIKNLAHEKFKYQEEVLIDKGGSYKLLFKKGKKFYVEVL